MPLPEKYNGHGGRLRDAVQRYNIPYDNWLDLSTGINPSGWPVPPLSGECWQRLPESDDGLEVAAHRYYRTELLLPVAGSQSAIQILPQLRPHSRVGVLHPGFSEHGAAWRRHGHEVVNLDSAAIDEELKTLDVLIIINPNNPSGESFSRLRLLEWQRHLAQRNGWLVVDEAFIDTTPEMSLAGETGVEGLVVLRSMGKFFGLAGIRLGFVLAWPELLQALHEQTGPWTINGPAREVAKQALRDSAWQLTTRKALRQQSLRLSELLQQHGLEPTGCTALFQWVCTAAAAELHNHLAQRGILTRLFHEPAALRFGLPGQEPAWQRLREALAGISRQQDMRENKW